MISAEVDLKELERDLLKVAADFGEANETGIARWGVAVCRRLVSNTQAWGQGKNDAGEGSTARQKQIKAMAKDFYKVAVVLRDPKLCKRIMSKSLTGCVLQGVKWDFRPHQNITTPQGLNDWLDLNRTSRGARPPKRGLPNGVRVVTTEKVMNQALKIRSTRAGKAKGGWVGAGQDIGKFQKMGSRLTIGKNVANYSHKHKSGGTAAMRKNTWNPEGDLINGYRHVSQERVLKTSDIEKAIADGARNTITWYEKALQGRLNRRNK